MNSKKSEEKILVGYFDPPDKLVYGWIDMDYESFYKACHGSFTDIEVEDFDGIAFAQKDTKETLAFEKMDLLGILALKQSGIFHGFSLKDGNMQSLTDAQQLQLSNVIIKEKQKAIHLG